MFRSVGEEAKSFSLRCTDQKPGFVDGVPKLLFDSS